MLYNKWMNGTLSHLSCPHSPAGPGKPCGTDKMVFIWTEFVKFCVSLNLQHAHWCSLQTLIKHLKRMTASSCLWLTQKTYHKMCLYQHDRPTSIEQLIFRVSPADQRHLINSGRWIFLFVFIEEGILISIRIKMVINYPFHAGLCG